MARKTTSIKIDEELWKELKVNCIKKDKDISDYLEEIIKKQLNKSSTGKNKEKRGRK